MNRTGRIIFASLIAAIGLGAVSPALAYDPTRSRWYRATQWVDPTYRAMNRIMRTPPRFVPRRSMRETTGLSFTRPGSEAPGAQADFDYQR